MNKISTDIELSQAFGIEISEDYQMALELLRIDASSSLIKFRKITEVFCRIALEANSPDFQGSDLSSCITELFNIKVIHYDLKNRLHDIRLLGNKSAHSNVDSFKGVDEQTIPELIQSYEIRLKKDAIKARTLTVKNMEDMHKIINKTPDYITVTISDIPDKSWGVTLAEAATTSCFKTNLKAGKIYESLANNMRIKDLHNESFEFDYRYIGLKKLAATQYELAYRLSSNQDKNLKTAIEKNKSKFLRNKFETDTAFEERKDRITSGYTDAIFKEKAHPESLFLYWTVNAEFHFLNGEMPADCDWMLEASAKLGHPEAQAAFGDVLLNKGRIPEAILMLKKSIKSDIDLGYRCLAGIYGDPNFEDYDTSIAFKYLNRGVEVNGPECLFSLGVLYHEGTWFEKSETKAIELILRSIQIGSFGAEDYYLEKILKVKAKQQNEVKEPAINLSKAIGRNSLCECGSGKKHKKCCLS
jgi:TPR repeat protein